MIRHEDIYPRRLKMSLVRWEPLRSLWPTEMERLFDGIWDAPPVAGLCRHTPAMDLSESETAYVLRADLPGMSINDVKIELEENVLTVSGERHHEEESRDGGYYRRERSFGTFARTLLLPHGVDAERIEANLTDGVLEVRIPKPEVLTAHRVEIKVGDMLPVVEAKAVADQPSESADESADA